MKIEFGFQSNCSELVTHLGLVDKDEIINGLNAISKATGWTWGSSFGSIMLPIPPERIADVIVVKKEEIGVNPEKILVVLQNLLDADTIELLKDRAISPLPLLYLELYNGPADNIIPKSKTLRRLTAYMACECGKKGLYINLFQHTEIQLMPGFHTIRRIFNSDFRGHDGGSSQPYLQWMAYHFADKEKTKKHIYENYKKYYPKKDPGVLLNETVSTYEEFPPQDKSQPPTKKEIKGIKEWLNNG